MSLQCGIVGLPNVGKSTLFNALTQAKAESANYPFCTIDPNVGVVSVPDPRLSQISELIPPEKLIPTSMEFVDIAGLVAGASKGEGLGNQFLGHIRETDAILHVVRCFENSDVVHVSGKVDPLADIDVISTELLLADLESVQKKYDKVKKVAPTTKDSQILQQWSLLQKLLPHLEEGQPASSLEVSEEEQKELKHLQLITAKPVLYVCNVSEDLEKDNQWVQLVKKRAQQENNNCLSISCALEAEISELDLEEQKEFLDGLGQTEPGLHRLIRASYALLELQTYFTAGVKEVRAWTIKKGYKAPQAAGVIHTDFEKGFIRAEVYHCEDLFELKTEAAIKEAGKYRSEGKEYVVQDGDVIFFKFNV